MTALTWDIRQGDALTLLRYLPHAFAVSQADDFCVWCGGSEKSRWHVPDFDRWCIVCGVYSGQIVGGKATVLQPYLAWRRCTVCARRAGDRSPEIDAYQNDPSFMANALAIDVMEQVIAKLGDKTQTWLAETMGVSRQQVSKTLSAPPNLTLLSLARLAVALGAKPRIIFDDREEEG